MVSERPTTSLQYIEFDRLLETHTMPESEIDQWRLALEGNLGIPLSDGNDVQLLKNGIRIFPAMLEAINGARESIELLTYIYWSGGIAEQFAQALAARAADGVNARVLLDAWGSRPIPDALIKQMRSAGVDVRWYRPVRWWQFAKLDNRTHRKVLICDGEVGFTGGVGIASEWDGDARNPNEWRETHLSVRGPAVHGLRGAFLANWSATGKPGFEPGTQVRPCAKAGDMPVQVLRSTGADSWNDMATLMHLIVSRSSRHIRITSAYFVPNPQLKKLLKAAVQRGVTVDIMVPGPYHDQPVSQYVGQADFDELLQAGVRLWRYLPTMLHAKTITVDGVLASIGSANFNRRSMRKDDEINLTALDADLTTQLDAHFEQDQVECEQIILEKWRMRGWRQRFLEWACQLIQEQV